MLALDFKREGRRRINTIRRRSDVGEMDGDSFGLRNDRIDLDVSMVMGGGVGVLVGVLC